MVSPFGNTLPLTDAPYYSRLNDNFTPSTGEDTKNYYLLGFNPGYALQASELNEIQELFFLNLNLTQRMNSNWLSVQGYRIPFWEGMIPVNSNLISISSISATNGTLSFTVTFDAGWYMWTDPSTKMSFWVYSDTSYTKTISTPGTVSVGFIGSKNNVTCCPSDDNLCDENQDSEIRDNSQGDTNTYNTCGASRKNVKFTDIEARTTIQITNTYFPVLTATISGSNYTISYADGQQAVTVQDET
jgi:hypothetical protein